ncbi:MAG: hypothetical protein IPH48_12365 [bacterium]|nr:hypothetical protein [bacterium]
MDISATAKQRSENKRARGDNAATSGFACGSSASRKKNPLSTSLRSATHATDSTCNGWIANSAATSAGRQTAPVNRRRSKYSSSVLATCSAMFVR